MQEAAAHGFMPASEEEDALRQWETEHGFSPDFQAKRHVTHTELLRRLSQDDSNDQ